jgi:hypothetical protein
MTKAEFRDYHEREAMRMRSLIANATTPALKARLLEEVRKHDRLAAGELVELAISRLRPSRAPSGRVDTPPPR